MTQNAQTIKNKYFFSLLRDIMKIVKRQVTQTEKEYLICMTKMVQHLLNEQEKD